MMIEKYRVPVSDIRTGDNVSIKNEAGIEREIRVTSVSYLGGKAEIRGVHIDARNNEVIDHKAVAQRLAGELSQQRPELQYSVWQKYQKTRVYVTGRDHEKLGFAVIKYNGEIDCSNLRNPPSKAAPILDIAADAAAKIQAEGHKTKQYLVNQDAVIVKVNRRPAQDIVHDAGYEEIKRRVEERINERQFEKLKVELPDLKKYHFINPAKATQKIVEGKVLGTIDRHDRYVIVESAGKQIIIPDRDKKFNISMIGRDITFSAKSFQIQQPTQKQQAQISNPLSMAR